MPLHQCFPGSCHPHHEGIAHGKEADGLAGGSIHTHAAGLLVLTPWPQGRLRMSHFDFRSWTRTLNIFFFFGYFGHLAGQGSMYWLILSSACDGPVIIRPQCMVREPAHYKPLLAVKGMFVNCLISVKLDGCYLGWACWQRQCCTGQLHDTPSSSNYSCLPMW